jgi:hypothetical protein
VKANNSHSKSASVSLKILLIFGVSLILFGIGFCGFQVHTLSNRQETMKKDYMVINSVSFGLLCVDEWRDNIVAAAKEQIQKFQLTPQQNRDLKKETEQILHAVINKAVSSIQKPSKNIGKKLEKVAFNALAVGLTSTMIQIDARIASMDFHLLGQNVSFKNQVLFFQSKSIVDVVQILIKTSKSIP